MKIILDAHISPNLALWISENFQVECVSLKYLEMTKFTDTSIFKYACNHGDIIMTKDYDFINLLERFGPPPQILHINSGNTSLKRLKSILGVSLRKAIELLNSNEKLVEIKY